MTETDEGEGVPEVLAEVLASMVIHVAYDLELTGIEPMNESMEADVNRLYTGLVDIIMSGDTDPGFLRPKILDSAFAKDSAVVAHLFRRATWDEPMVPAAGTLSQGRPCCVIRGLEVDGHSPYVMVTGLRGGERLKRAALIGWTFAQDPLDPDIPYIDHKDVVVLAQALTQLTVLAQHTGTWQAGFAPLWILGLDHLTGRWVDEYRSNPLLAQKVQELTPAGDVLDLGKLAEDLIDEAALEQKSGCLFGWLRRWFSR